MRKISMKKITEVLRLHLKLDLSLRQSATLCKVSLGTASNYIKRFNELDITIDEFISYDEMKQEKLFYPAKIGVKTQALKVMPDLIYIHNELKKKRQTKVTLALLHDEYKELYGDKAYSYTQFREHYVRFLNKINPSMKQVHLSGEKLFVDYSGLTMPIVNNKTGEITTAQIFVAVLGASGYTYVDSTYSQKQRDFILSHVKAYEFFGGVPKIVVPDNLKSAVIKNNKKDGVIINQSYATLARHYGMAVEPARVYKPKDKSKAELGVKGIQRWILASLRKRTFYSVDELNDAISILLDKYNNKIVKKFKKSRTEMFEELDKPYLQPLPANRFIYRDYKSAKVSPSYHIILDNCEYSVPFKYLSHIVDVWYSAQTVEIYYKGKLIATHPKLHFAGDISTLKEHMPKNHQYQHEKTNPGKFLNWASNIGDNTLICVKNQFDNVIHPPNAYRKLNAVLSLASTYGKSELDMAISYANEHNLVNTASIKSILDKKLYLQNPVNNTSDVKIHNTHQYLRGNIYQ
ncbi:IS21 family transposase [Poseidonibacter sp.]|uniref:IS21 family transposase n=1 Tax=Poseidonibacter sp. TaxID=2321188 RepID=UPI003C767C1D